MKSIKTVVALAIAFAASCSAVSASADGQQASSTERQFSQKMGLNVDRARGYFDEANHRIDFAKFKREVDAGRGFKIAKHELSGGFIAMKLNDQASSAK